MKRIAIYTAAATVAMAGSISLGIGAQANTGATEHCDASLFPNKVELQNGGTSAQTGLQPGTRVCIKAGTKTVIVAVDANGSITQNTIMNKPGNAYLGISYYAYGDRPDCGSTGCP